MTGRQALRRLLAGTAVILRELTWAGEWRETLARWLIASVVGALTLSTVSLHPWLAPVPMLLWIAAASAAAPPDDEPEEDDEPDDEPPLDSDAFLELLHELSGGANLHLVTVRTALAEEVPGYDWSGPEVTALCRAAGVPIRPGVRVAGAQPAVTTGIHRADLPPLPSPTSGAPVGVVGAGQDSNNNSNTTRVTPLGEGAWINSQGPSTRQAARK